MKSVALRPKIDSLDYGRKVQLVQKWLRLGEPVSVRVMCRGREMAHPHLAEILLRRLVNLCSDCGDMESGSVWDGRNLSVVLRPSDGRGGVFARVPGVPSGDSEGAEADIAAGRVTRYLTDDDFFADLE